MKQTWTKLKDIIRTYEHHKNIFLSLIDGEGKIVCANANMIKTLQLKNPRTETTNFFDLLDSLNKSEFKAAIKDAGENKPYSLEINLKNGYYHPMKWQVNCLKNITGNLAYLCLGQKIADDKSTASAIKLKTDYLSEKDNHNTGIKKSKGLFSSFLESTPNMAWVVNEDSTLLFASKAFYDYFVLDEKEALNKNIADVIPAVVAEVLYKRHKQVLKTGKSTEHIENVKWSDGTDFVFHVNVFPMEEQDGKKLLGGHAVNMEEKNNRERQLQETNERLLLLTRATSDAIWEWDMQTGKIFRNEVLMDMIGYQTDNPKGLSWWLRRIHPEDRNRVSDKVKESTEKNNLSWEDEYRFKCVDGKYKFMRDKGFIVYENGLPVKMIGSLHDISNLKQLESCLLEEKLARQKEISEMVIHVQESERTRIGHELHDNVNQILSTTKLFVDMLTPVSKEEKEVKQKSLEYLMMAIEEIRKLSKELVIPHLKDNGLLTSIESLIEDINLSTHIKIKFIHDHENDQLSPGKKVALFRIVQEQLKNILKHSKAKNIEILLQSKENDIFLQVKDDGVGFDSKQTQRGIGLSNIYERTRFYDGTVQLQTSPGKGCVLKISIPAL